MKAKLIIGIVGNIAAGKTSLLEFIEGCPGCSVTYEPVEKWTTPKVSLLFLKWKKFFKENILDLFYNDPERWSLTLQVCVLISIVDTLSEPTHQFNFVERTQGCSKNVFVPVCRGKV